jgi:hypothetical protein
MLLRLDPKVHSFPRYESTRRLTLLTRGPLESLGASLPLLPSAVALNLRGPPSFSHSLHPYFPLHGTVATFCYARVTLARVRIARVYRPWYNVTSVHPQGTPHGLIVLFLKSHPHQIAPNGRLIIFSVSPTPPLCMPKFFCPLFVHPPVLLVGQKAGH